MAQEVDYHANHVVYTEGPFVIVFVAGWRIECDLLGSDCPVLPDGTIYTIMRENKLDGKSNNRELVADVCDKLNSMVASGAIIQDNNWWVYKNQKGA